MMQLAASIHNAYKIKASIHNAYKINKSKFLSFRLILIHPGILKIYEQKKYLFILMLLPGAKY